MTNSFQSELKNGCSTFGIELSKVQEEQLFRYYEMVIEKNKVMNLTAVTEEKDFVQKHILDSLAVVWAGDAVREILLAGDISVMDVGTGAGLPGLVLKIAFPHLRVTLFDSLQKRLRFLDEVIGELGLNGIETLHGRAEDIGQDKKYRESYDFVTSRAVAKLSVLAEYCLPLVKPCGLFVPYKSADVDAELQEAAHPVKMLGAEVCAVEKYLLPGTDISRSLIIMEKVKHTPKEFPRRAGTPAKSPLQ